MVSVTLPIFFIEYLKSGESEGQKIFNDTAIRHSNTALGVHAIWFAVSEYQTSLRLLNDVGFNESGRTVTLFNVKGDEVSAGTGVLSLLSGKDKQQEPARYLANHTDGMVAISVQVSDLNIAKLKAESALDAKLKTYTGAFGKSFLIPAVNAHGLWVEMFQQ